MLAHVLNGERYKEEEEESMGLAHGHACGKEDVPGSNSEENIANPANNRNGYNGNF